MDPDMEDPRDRTLVSEPAERGTPLAALVDALFDEDVERCRQLLDAHPELVNTPLRHPADCRGGMIRDSAWGYTYRARAAHNWNTAAIQALLHLGADPDATDEHGGHPLHWAAIGRCLEDYPKSRRISHTGSALRAARIKELLLDAGADATVRDAQGRTAAEIEEAMSQELRRGREKNLEELARPRPEFGRGRGRGFGRGWWTSPAPAPAPREAGGVDVSAGAGYGR
ncbi:hypothetical protein NEMBOFW57_007305 [Staphylotrichum longicolle]|uniref:Ankyrin repeat domain-containing protein n=1 Tax=Staphylotrichum longicolle TaxID=669026 RepID=A0AAD4HYY1_9PEZI|nr:hypothetical protein NEMBOFW57_007305 [Staphylotrichum longicolle]